MVALQAKSAPPLAFVNRFIGVQPSGLCVYHPRLLLRGSSREKEPSRPTTGPSRKMFATRPPTTPARRCKLRKPS